MLQVFFQNLLSKMGFIFILPLLLGSGSMSAQDELPGIFERFNTILQSQEKIFQSLKSRAQVDNFSRDIINDFKTDIILNPQFINLILLNTPVSYHHLIKKDECTLYDLLLTDLVQLPPKYKEQIYFDYRTKKGEIKTGSLPLSKFFKEIVSQQCPGVLKISKNFDLNNVSNTLKSLKIRFPNKANECPDYFDRFLKNAASPYLCHIVKNIKGIEGWSREAKNPKAAKDIKRRQQLKRLIERAQAYKRIMSPSVFEKLEVTCERLNNIQRGCYELFSENYWASIYKQDQTSPILKTFCSQKKPKQCIRELAESSLICSEQLKYFPSLSPAPLCPNIEAGLKDTNLKIDYLDCPAKVGNESLTIFSRILRHFGLFNQASTSGCEINAINPTAKFLEEVSELDNWGLKICYDDKIKRKEVCYPFMFGNAEGSDFSLSTVVGKVAARLKGYNYQDSPCEIIEKSEYRPALLKYKNGCFIIKKDDSCNGTKCDFEVIISETSFLDFSIKNDLLVNLLPYDYIHEASSLLRLLQKNQKLVVKKVQSVISMQTTRSNHKDAIFLGVGCAEDLLPTFFKRERLNQCRSLPFLVDHIYEHQGEYAMLTRTALDHVHAPRKIPWSYIFNSIKEFQLIHPTNLWSLYAIHK